MYGKGLADSRHLNLVLSALLGSCLTIADLSDELLQSDHYLNMDTLSRDIVEMLLPTILQKNFINNTLHTQSKQTITTQQPHRSSLKKVIGLDNKLSSQY